MTRMAPKPAGYTRAAQSRAAHSTDLRWRIARTGALVLTLDPLSTGADGAAELAIELRLESAPRDARHAGGAGVQTLKGRGRLVASEGEVTVSVDLRAPADTCISASMVFLERIGTPEILVLTDLPARIGLRGGTYVLDAASSRQAIESLRSFGRGP